MYMAGAHGGQKRVSGLLEQELWMVLKTKPPLQDQQVLLASTPFLLYSLMGSHTGPGAH